MLRSAAMAAGLSALMTSATAITPARLTGLREEQGRFALFRERFGFLRGWSGAHRPARR